MTGGAIVSLRWAMVGVRVDMLAGVCATLVIVAAITWAAAVTASHATGVRTGEFFNEPAGTGVVGVDESMSAVAMAAVELLPTPA